MYIAVMLGAVLIAEPCSILFCIALSFKKEMNTEGIGGIEDPMN